ncbi:hypothetical protein LPJ55_001775 [Coemansia sp. RSA 990]|nr:hypothetical protein LPJ68_000996 [Coemansia sp. RSA 1086]KAJ1751996.1 hypothetical protein LPJ79_001623 [Coemansia sp. RSA 1821]KAJ1874072.1 hypothetical protein LPJ55_001775 [Coemansia sp. RSA 990]KAJ2671254.1 hypothetical protein IWW42_003516 [Coemansia sp. RSA 1085]
MPAEKLLPEIVERIFTYLTRDTTSTEDTWTYQLTLLAVCRTWRYVGLSMVYRHLFISSATKTAAIDRQCPEWKKDVVTNIDLIVAQGYQPLAKSFKINLCDLSISTMLQFANQKLAVSEISWNHISEFILHAESDYAINMEDNENIIINQAIHQFVTLLPGIDRLKLEFHEDDFGCTELVDHMKKRYGYQITYLDGNSSSLQGNHKLSNLSYLRVEFAVESEVSQNHINAESLKHIKLYDLFPFELWSMLYSSNSNGILFKNLQTLSLCPYSMYSDLECHSVETQIYAQLQFPELRSLEMSINADSQKLIQYAHFPSKLQKLRIHSVDGEDIVVKDIKFGMAERRQLAAHIGQACQGDALPLANYLLGKETNASYAFMRAFGNSPLLRNKQLCLPQLSCLCIIGITCTEKIHKLLSSLSLRLPENYPVTKIHDEMYINVRISTQTIQLK